MLGVDRLLDDALRYAGQARCLVIPASLRSLAPYQDDPRLRQFIERVQAAGARIVAADSDYAAVQLLPERVQVYPPGEDVFQFARQLARSL